MAGRHVGSKGTNSWARGRVGHVGHAGDLTILTGGGGPAKSGGATPGGFLQVRQLTFRPPLFQPAATPFLARSISLLGAGRWTGQDGEPCRISPAARCCLAGAG